MGGREADVLVHVEPGDARPVDRRAGGFDQAREERQLRRARREHEVRVPALVDRAVNDGRGVARRADRERVDRLVDANRQLLDPPLLHANCGSHLDVAVIISSAIRCRAW